MSAANEPRERSAPAACLAAARKSEGGKRRARESVGGSDGAKPLGQVIDAHQHFWRYDPREYEWIDDSMQALQHDFLPPDLQREMARAGVTASIAVQARQTLDETRWLLELSDRYPSITGVVGWIDLGADDIGGQLEEFSSRPALVGIRHVVQGEPDGFLARPAFLAGVAKLDGTGLVYDILVYARQLPQAVAFARAFPRQPFVLDHLGKPDIRGNGFQEWRRHFAELAALPNVACKLSGLVTEADWHSWTPALLRPYLDTALEAFGPSRLMIGSDWPVCTAAASYDTVIDLVRDAIAEYRDSERQQILQGTAQSVYLAKVEHQR